jgi:hypothetical protein
MPPSPHSIRLSPISEKTVVQEANATPSIKLRLKMSITEMQFRQKFVVNLANTHFFAPDIS